MPRIYSDWIAHTVGIKQRIILVRRRPGNFQVLAIVEEASKKPVSRVLNIG
jgi:hypothetical protein